MKLTIAAPNPKQKEFFQADTRYVAYGGARGGGKSWAVRTKATLMAAKYPGIRILIMRKTFPGAQGKSYSSFDERSTWHSKLQRKQEGVFLYQWKSD